MSNHDYHKAVSDLRTKGARYTLPHDGNPPKKPWRGRFTKLARFTAIWAVVIGTVSVVVGTLVGSKWDASTTVRHYIAYFNCDAARFVGLAPAVRESPGYWTRLDRDNDGFSCERWRGRKR